MKLYKKNNHVERVNKKILKPSEKFLQTKVNSIQGKYY